MKRWSHPALAILAVLALAFPALPSQAWYCPMSGRVGDAAFVCAAKVQDKDGAMRPCAHPGSKCCRPVQVPPSDTAATLQRPAAVAAVLTKGLNLTPRHGSGYGHHYAVPVGLITLLRPRGAVTARAADSYYFATRHGPPLTSGRGPPAA